MIFLDEFMHDLYIIRQIYTRFIHDRYSFKDINAHKLEDRFQGVH